MSEDKSVMDQIRGIPLIFWAMLVVGCFSCGCGGFFTGALMGLAARPH